MSQLSAIVLLLSSCADNEKPKNVTVSAEHLPIPHQVEQEIRREFPGAKPYHLAIDSLLQKLAKLGITPDQILWGESTCVDDIISTKNKQVHPEIKGPFMIGGLAGIPFTGITGINAFAHHVPEDGTALLFVGPHIGYNADESWGKIIRHGQHHSSTCCGALYAALQKLQKGELKQKDPTGDDYQEQYIEQIAFAQQEKIKQASDPLVALTQIVCTETEQKMVQYSKQAKERKFRFAVFVVGVIINTDYRYDDYLWIKKIAIKDVRTDKWIEGEE